MPVSPAVAEATDALLAALLGALDRVEWAQRHLFPPRAIELANRLTPHARRLAEPLRALEAAAWPEDLRLLRERLVQVARQAVELIEAFAVAARSGQPIELYRAVRRFAPLQDALYPLAPVLEPVSRWFLEPARRGDDVLVRRLRDAALREDGAQVGVLHARNDRGSRGGFSLYVPETWGPAGAMPLIVALHGGSGHGRDFLWSWLREARARGALVLAPTALDRTWSIMGGEDVDGPRLRAAVEDVAARYRVDRSRVLLTGMSDGATYALLCGLAEGMPFTHLAPACGVLHPFLLARGGIEGARGRPVYLVHGALDWMFPVQTARMGRDALEAAGARVVYREIADLSHTYPRDENPRILDWLLGPVRPAEAGPRSG
ncbi:MAG TPA: PHB depolymerase family esterase [Methylomirabilota bacterium]|nr:PHB depolymerase family esterase [Methylomirabilota bacterium]